MKQGYLSVVLAGLLSVSAAHAADTVVIGASATPHGVVLAHIKPILAKQGLTSSPA